MSQIGEELRLQREAMGISLREVEEATKIRMKYLIALEADDFDALPGKVYVIGFLRTYARYLGINDEELVNNLKAAHHFTVHEEEIKDTPPTVSKSYKPMIYVLIIALALAIGGISLTFFRDHDNNPPSENLPQTETPQAEGESPGSLPAPSEGETPNDADNEPEISGVSVTVIVREASCWVAVKIDGRNDFNGTLTAGENRTFIGQERISIKYGNAGVVEAISNGERVYPVGNMGQVITMEYTENENN